MELIMNTATHLSAFFREFEGKVKGMILDEKTLDELLEEARREVKNHLTNIFGAEDNTKDLGIVQDILPYYHQIEEKLKDGFSDAVIFSYWTYRGEREKYAPEISGEWRDNFFYKGKRWSNDALREPFYDFFKLITEAMRGTEAEAPVNFFTKLGFNFGKQYFRLLTTATNKSNDSTVVLPTAKQLLALNLYKTTQAVEQIEKWRKYVSLPRVAETMRTALRTCSDSPENVKQSLLESAEELSSTELIIQIKNNIENVFSNKEAIQITNRDIALVVLAFIYYDHPYDIHFYLPAPQGEPVNEGKKKSPESALTITVKQGSTKIDEYKQPFLELSTALRGLHKVERQIWQQWKENLPTYWVWRKKHEEWKEKYEKLTEIAINICQAICRKHQIAFTHIPHRLKGFDSFYNKIVNIANKKKGTEEELKQAKLFKTAIEQNDVSYITSELKDIAGTRVVCIFEDDIDSFKAEFEVLNECKEIEIVMRIDYSPSVDPISCPNATNVFDYRSYHIIFKLGPKRLELYDCVDLKLDGLKCELQIRSVLAHGWAEASHDLVYKPGVLWSCCPCEDRKKIESDLNSIARTLYGADQHLIKVRGEVKQLLSSLKKDK